MIAIRCPATAQRTIILRGATGRESFLWTGTLTGLSALMLPTTQRACCKAPRVQRHLGGVSQGRLRCRVLPGEGMLVQPLARDCAVLSALFFTPCTAQTLYSCLST